eukprot:6427784-Pyramimonas_sp.AAC.1
MRTRLLVLAGIAPRKASSRESHEMHMLLMMAPSLLRNLREPTIAVRILELGPRPHEPLEEALAQGAQPVDHAFPLRP